MTTGELPPKEIFAGVPNTARGEPTRIHADPSGKTDRIAYGAGRSAVVRSLSNPLDCHVFTMHTGTVTSVIFSPDGSVVASADEAGYVRVWIPGQTVKPQKYELGVSMAPIRDIAFSADMKFMIVGSDSRGGYVKAIKYPAGSNGGSCPGHQKKVFAVDVRQVGSPKIASGGEDMLVGLFVGPPVKDSNVPNLLRHHKNFINAVCFSPDGTKLATCSSDKSVIITDAESGEVIKTIEGMFEGSTLGLHWNKDSTELVAASADKTLRILDVASGEVKSAVKIGNNVGDMQNGCAWVSKSNEIVGVSLTGDINILEPGQGSPKSVLRGHSKTVVGLATVGNKIYSADYSGQVVAWEAGVGCCPTGFSGKGPVTACAIDANSKFVVTLGQDGNLFITPTETLAFGKPVKIKGGGCDVAVPSSPDAAVAAAMINESRMAVVGPGGDIIAQKDFERSEKGCSIAVSADGSLIAYGLEVSGGAGEIRFAQLSSGSLNKAGEKISSNSAANRLALCPEAKILVVGEKSRRVRMYEALTGNKVEGGGITHTARCDAVAISPDGKSAITGGLDGSLAVWAIGSEAEPQKVTSSHRGGVTGAGFLESGAVVSGGNDSTLRSWSVAA